MISIIVLAHNQHEMTEQCIESVRANTQDYELILVDNGSDPVIPADDMVSVATIGSMHKYEHFIKGSSLSRVDILFRNEKNIGFPAAVNQGIREASGDIICLLNNDTVVTSGWLKRLTEVVESGYDIVGPMTNYVAGLQRAQTSSYDDEISLDMAAGKWASENKGIIKEVNFVIGFCMVFKKSLFDELGDFDESMWPSSGEEIDFCLRARRAGHKVGIVKDVYIHHYGSATFKDMQQAGQLNYQTVCRECDKHLAEKWGVDFWKSQGRIKKNIDSSIRLNLGCGIYKLPGFLNIDQNPDVNPYMVCDALNLPFETGTVDEIYCGHMLEHLTLEDGKKAVKYWYSLLSPGGVITITVPDFEYCLEEYMKNPTTTALKKMNDEIIYSYCQKSHHKYCYSGDLLKELMVDAGFVDLKKMPLNHPYFASPVKWQIAYEGRKA